MTRKYTITLTEEQLMLISNCVEDILRFLAGQTELHHATAVLDKCNPVRNRLEDMKPLVTPGLRPSQSYDWAGNCCPNEAQRKMIAATYYLYREMRHQYTLANKHNNVYSSPTLRCKDSGEPIRITWEDD